jgi:hypothetical protein
MFKVGSMPPKNYVAWHEWAEVQTKGGLEQSQCAKCFLWLFPQEVESHECPPPLLSAVEVFAQLSAICGKYYADVDDVVAYVSEIRARPTPRALDGACASCQREFTPECPIRTGNGCDLYQTRR